MNFFFICFFLGENPAAMQHGASQGLRSTFLLTVVLTLVSVLRWPQGFDERHLILIY